MRRRFWRAVERFADAVDTMGSAFWQWAYDKIDETESEEHMAIVGTPTLNFTIDWVGEQKLPTAPEPKARTSTKPIRAYREWALRFEGPEPYLASVLVDQRWDGPILRSDHKPHFHTEPGAGDQLGHGIYAYPLVCGEMDRGQTGRLVGAMRAFQIQLMGGPSAPAVARAEGEVELMGRVVRHTRGYRAEAARIVRLFIRDLPGHYDREDVIRRMEARYQCEVSMMPLYDPERLRAPQPDEPEPKAPTEEGDPRTITVPLLGLPPHFLLTGGR